MDISSIAALSTNSISTLLQAQSQVAKNIANFSTPGFQHRLVDVQKSLSTNSPDLAGTTLHYIDDVKADHGDFLAEMATYESRLKLISTSTSELYKLHRLAIKGSR